MMRFTGYRCDSCGAELQQDGSRFTASIIPYEDGHATRAEIRADLCGDCVAKLNGREGRRRGRPAKAVAS